MAMDLHKRDQVSMSSIEDYDGQTMDDGAVSGGNTTILGDQSNRYMVPPVGSEPTGAYTGGAPSYIAAPIPPATPPSQHGMQPSYQAPLVPKQDPSVPVSELFELADRFIIVLDMPGLDKSSIDIKYDHPNILVQANRPDLIELMKESHGELLLQNSKKKYYGKMGAGFAINKNIDSVEAEYADGILTITALFKKKGEVAIKVK